MTAEQLVEKDFTREATEDEAEAAFEALKGHRIGSRDLEASDESDVTVFVENGTESYIIATINIILPWEKVAAGL